VDRLKNLKKWYLFLALAVVVFAVSAPVFAVQSDKAEYAGADKCKMCHLKEYQSWEKMKHSKAFNTIANEPDKEKCYSCHTTGYGKATGFNDPEKTGNLKNVQCEACHGPGSEHLATKMTDKEARKATVNLRVDCIACHKPHVVDTAAAARTAGPKAEGAK
jgi:hypothetical protein